MFVVDDDDDDDDDDEDESDLVDSPPSVPHLVTTSGIVQFVVGINAQTHLLTTVGHRSELAYMTPSFAMLLLDSQGAKTAHGYSPTKIPKKAEAEPQPELTVCEIFILDVAHSALLGGNCTAAMACRCDSILAS